MFKKVIDTLCNILNDGAYSNIAINSVISSIKDEKDKKLYTKLVYGVIENKLLIDYYMQPLTAGKRIKPFVKNALRVGCYAIDNLNLANHYIVNMVVSAVKKKDYKASTFVNAILRKYINIGKRSLEGLNKLDYYSIKYSIDKSLVELLVSQYGDKFESFFCEMNDVYNTYRINTLKTNTYEVKKYLEEKNINYEITNNVILQTKESLINSILFKNGQIVAQDKSSIMVGLVANPKINDTILDTCSAPGSKSMHIASIINNKGTIISLDIYEHKIKLINENKEKLGVTCVNAMLLDARHLDDLGFFDIVITDVPCSGLGVIRHKPDLKYQMNLEKINGIKVLQKEILESASRHVKNGGVLVYSTCTINKDENENLINEFLEKNKFLYKEEEHIMLPSNKEDGFYICKIRGF